MIKVDEYNQVLKQALPELPGGLFSDVRRTEAMEVLGRIGMPSRAIEDWKYSDSKALVSKCFRPALQSTADELPKAVSDWPQLIFVNGVLAAGDVDRIKGIELLTLSTAFDGPDWAHPILDVQPDDALANFNLAFAQGGFAIRISDEFNVDGLELVMVYDGTAAEACHVRNLVLVEENAHLNLMSRTLQSGHIGWINQETIIQVAANARLDHYVDLASGTKGFLSVSEHVHLGGGEYNQHSLLMGAASARHVISAEITKAGSNATLNGAFLAGHGETLDTLTRIKHATPDATSDQCFKGVLSKGGKSAFQGRIVVEQDAQHTVANQASSNLVLDKTAEANVKPELLIYADDVKCAHGATVGALDEAALFYLTQRGIEPRAAHALLVGAFLGEVIDAMPDAAIRAHFAGKVEGWMSQATKSLTNPSIDQGDAA